VDYTYASGLVYERTTYASRLLIRVDYSCESGLLIRVDYLLRTTDELSPDELTTYWHSLLRHKLLWHLS
jgi:hypothetical protein